MKRKTKKRGRGIFFVLLAILFLIIWLQQMKMEQMLQEQRLNKSGDAAASDTEDEDGEEADSASVFDFFRRKSDAEEEAVLEEDDTQLQVLAIVAKQIDPSLDSETVMAQCVIARTSLYDAWKCGTAEPDGMSLTDMKNVWGDDFEQYYEVLETCVAATSGEVLTYEGEYIYAAYHAVSAGTTRRMSELYESVNMPYLTEVSCPQDAAADGYLSVFYWDTDVFLEMCSELTDGGTLTSLDEIEIGERDSAEYVLEIRLGSQTLSGEEFRTSLGLNSACFTITEMEDHVRVVTKGIGHGFGLSQYTAEQMAKSGSTYQEILATFFPGAVLEKTEEF